MTFSPNPANNRIQFSCANCNTQLQAVVEQVVLPGTPAMQQLQNGTLNRVRCTNCGQEGFLPFPFMVFLPYESKAICFVHEAETMDEAKRNQIVQQLATVVQAATGGQALQSVALTGDYGQLVALAQASGDATAGAPATPPPLALLQKLLISDPNERYALITQNNDLLAEVTQVARTLLADPEFAKENPHFVTPLQNLLTELEYSGRHSNEAN